MAKFTIQDLKKMQTAYKFYTPNQLEALEQQLKKESCISIDVLIEYFTSCYFDTVVKNTSIVDDPQYWEKYCKDNSHPDLLPSTVKSREVDRLKDITSGTVRNCFFVIHYLEDLIVNQVINKEENPFTEIEFDKTIENIKESKSITELNTMSVIQFDNMEQQFVNTYLKYCEIISYNI